jgi:aryl-alcohol dehydrogenase-like predicted oxidoreductase
MAQELQEEKGKEMVQKIRELTTIAEKELNTTISALALAWVARHPHTSTVILGASRPEQITENLKAIEVVPKLTDELLEKIDTVLKNKPAPSVRKIKFCPYHPTNFHVSLRLEDPH